MSRKKLAASRGTFLLAAGTLLLCGTFAWGGVFDVFAHNKKIRKPTCTHFNECFGYYHPTYKPWPNHCALNPALYGVPVKPLEHLPSPARAALEEPPSGPTAGVVWELERDPPLAAPSAIAPSTTPASR